MGSLQKLNDSNYLASIVYTHCLNYFQFEKSFNKNDKTYKRDVTPIVLKDFNTVLLEKFKHIPTPNLYNEKRELKQLYNQYLESKFIANYQFIDLNLVTDSLKDYPGFYQTIQNVLAKYPTLYGYFNSHKNNWTKEFNNTNELVRGVLSIDEYVNTIQLTQDLEFNMVEPEINEIRIAVENDEIITEKQVKKSYRVLELKKIQLNRSLKRFELKPIADKSNLVEKISKPITDKIDQTNRLNSMLRKIA